MTSPTAGRTPRCRSRRSGGGGRGRCRAARRQAAAGRACAARAPGHDAWCEAGFLLSLVQLAGMTLGLLAGWWRMPSACAGACSPGWPSWRWRARWAVWSGAGCPFGGFLLVLRALEGVGFLMAVMPGPGLIRSAGAAEAEKSAMGMWGAYMPLGVALALLAGPALIAHSGWQGWWWALSAVSGACALWVALVVPPDSRHMYARAQPAAWCPAPAPDRRRPRAADGLDWPSPCIHRNGWP